MSMTANQILEQLRSAFDCDERLWHPTYLKVYWCLNVCLFFLALNHLKQHRFNVLIAVKCLKTFYDHLILHLLVIRTRKLGFWWRKLLRIRHVIRVRHHGQGLGLPVQWHARLYPGCFAGPLWQKESRGSLQEIWATISAEWVIFHAVWCRIYSLFVQVISPSFFWFRASYILG